MGRAAIEEIAVISGRGGTGKTSVAAYFDVLAREAIGADCDVNDADLHLPLAPAIRERHEFERERRGELACDRSLEARCV